MPTPDARLLRALRRLAALVAPTALLVAPVPAVPASTAATTATSMDILVLGDSFAAGNGAGDYGPLCSRSPYNYAGQYATMLTRRTGQPATVTNAACGGAHTRHVFESQMAGVAPQIDAVDPHFDLILVTLDGNDLGYGPIRHNCLVVATQDARRCRAGLDRAELLLRSGEMRRRMRHVLTAVSAKAGPATTIVLVGHPYLEADHSLMFRGIAVGRRVTRIVDRDNAMKQRLVSALDTSSSVPIAFVPTSELFAGRAGWLRPRQQRHHELRKLRVTRHRWMVEPGIDSTTPGEMFHPNRRGWHMEAELLWRTPAVPRHPASAVP